MERLLVLPLLMVVLVGACGGDDDADDTSTPEDQRSDEEVAAEIRDDLEGLADALAAGNYDRVYDDFLTSECQGLVARETYIQTLQQNSAQLEAQRVQIDDVVLLSRNGADEAEVRVDFTLIQDDRPVPRDPEAPPNIEVVVFENGHWRSTECFGLEFAPTPTP